MLERNTINELFGITESYEMPDRVMEILMDEKARMRCFNEITKISPDMKEDFFLDYYQEEHGDRKELKQDYTPDCVAALASEMAGTAGTVADICAGTGSLHQIDKEIHDSEKKLLDMLLEMTGTTQESDRELKNAIEEYKNWMDDKYKKEVDDSC